MRTDEMSTPWSTLTHRNSLLSHAHATPRIPRSFDEEEGERECNTSSGCSSVNYDDQFPGSPRFYRNRTSKRREHQRQRRCRHGVTSGFGGSRVHRSEALLAALCISAVALFWIITRDGGISFPLLSLLGPRAFRARETDSITGIFGAGWAPNDAAEGLMATSRSSPHGHGATLLNDPRPPSEWLEKAEKFEIPFKTVNGEPRAIDRAENKHRAGGGGGGDRSIWNGNDPLKRDIDEGAPAQIIGAREDGLHEERVVSGTPMDVHKAVIVDTAIASAREKKREWSGEKIEGRPRSKVVEGDVENPRLDAVEGKGGGGGALGKDRTNETKEPPGTNTGGSIRSQGGGFPRKAGLSGGPDDDDKISLHTSSSIQGMTSNAVDLIAPITGKRVGKASPTGVEEIVVASGTPIRLSHRIRTEDIVESNGRETPGEGKKNPEAKINGLGEEKKQEVEETMNMRIATATDVAAPAEHENWSKKKDKKTKKGDEATYDKEALPAEWGGDIDRDDSGKRDMSSLDSKPQRTGGLTEHSPALLSEPIDAAIATGGLKKKTVRERTEVAALRIEAIEYAAHLAEEVARDEKHGEGRAAGGGGSAGTRLTGEDEGVRREQMADEGRGPVEAGTNFQATTVTQRPQRGEVVVNNEKPLRVRPPSRNASRWAQALGAGDDDDANENHPPLPPQPPTRDQRRKTGTDDEARASKETGKTCRLTGKVDHWEPPEAADLRSTYRWKDEQKATMEKIRRFSKGGNELRNLIHSEVVRLDILRHDLFCP